MNSLTVITETELLIHLKKEIQAMPVAMNEKVILSFGLKLVEEWMIFNNGTPLHQQFCQRLQLQPMPDAQQQLQQILDHHHKDQFCLKFGDMNTSSN